MGRPRKRRRPPLARLDRNESPFGTSAATLRAWEAQRKADPRKYGLNRYPDFFHTDMVTALQSRYGLSDANYTPLAGAGEVGNVLVAALLRDGGELVQSWPIEDQISRQTRAWHGRVKRVPLARSLGQNLEALAAAVGPKTRLVHLQNPHNPSGQSFGRAGLEALISAVAARNANAYVWVDEAYQPYSKRSDFPDCFAIIEQDPESSKLAVSRTLTAFGVAGAPTAFLAASQALTQQTEGITSGFFVPNAYGWANPEGGVSRIGEKAMLQALSNDGQAHLAKVRDRNAAARARLAALLRRHGFHVYPSDACFVLARAPGKYRHGGMASALRDQRVAVKGVGGWGAAHRGLIRVSVGSNAELDRLDHALTTLLATPKASHGSAPRRRRSVVAAAAGGAVAGVVARPAVARAAGALDRVALAEPDRVELTRRDFVRRTGLAAGAGTALLAGLSRAPAARAFPPDSFYDTFNLARMIYHENPVGPSTAALEAVRQVLSRGPGCASRYEENDRADLIDAILRYNRRLRPSAARLHPHNVMLLLGSAEGLMLTADTFVAGRTLVGEWPAYRIIRERVWQQGGTVVDVPLRNTDHQPDYAALLEALAAHKDAGLVHFNAQNNPVGTVIRRGEFDKFASKVFAKHPHTVILVDESDPEYMQPGQSAHQPDYLRYVADGKNVVHLQTFSHIFGLTGLRVGYLMAPRRLIARMKAKRIARPVNVFGHAAALAALGDAHAQVKRTFPVVDQGRDYICSELDKMGLHYHRSQGQYVLLDTGRSGTITWTQLIGLGVLTRYGREWGLESWLRVCPGRPEENKRFIASLRTVMGQPQPTNPPTLPFPIPNPYGKSLQRKLARDTWIESRLPPLERPYRVVPASVFRGG